MVRLAHRSLGAQPRKNWASTQRYGRSKTEEKYNAETLRRREIVEKGKSPPFAKRERWALTAPFSQPSRNCGPQP
jgi:hypothetical protein